MAHCFYHLLPFAYRPRHLSFAPIYIFHHVPDHHGLLGTLPHPFQAFSNSAHSLLFYPLDPTESISKQRIEPQSFFARIAPLSLRLRCSGRRSDAHHRPHSLVLFSIFPISVQIFCYRRAAGAKNHLLRELAVQRDGGQGYGRRFVTFPAMEHEHEQRGAGAVGFDPVP